MKDLNKLAQQIYEANKAKGFHEVKHSSEHMLCLVISELMEAVEADRKNRKADLKTFEEFMGGVKDKHYDIMYAKCFKEFIKDAVEDELADAVIRLLDTAGALEMRLEKIDKDNNFDYLATKDGFKKHSFTENVFHIVDRYFRSSENVNYRLSRMIFHIEILCEVLNIDLWKHVELKLKYNSLRPYKHGKKY